LGHHRGHVSPHPCTTRALTYVYVLKVINQIHHTHEAIRKSVSYLPLATRGQSGSGIRSHHDHHSEEFPLVATFHCVQPLLRVPFNSIYCHELQLWAVSYLVSLLSSSRCLPTEPFVGVVLACTSIAFAALFPQAVYLCYLLPLACCPVPLYWFVLQ
jgi:hypothetical protein